MMRLELSDKQEWLIRNALTELRLLVKDDAKTAASLGTTEGESLRAGFEATKQDIDLLLAEMDDAEDTGLRA